MLFLGVENPDEAPLLERGDIDPIARRIERGRVADDIDQPVERMQTTEQVVVLAIGAGQKRGEMAEADRPSSSRFRRTP